MRLLPLALLLLAACGEPDPRARSAPAYVDALEPLLYENGFLAERLVGTAAAIHGDSLRADGVLTAWRTEVVPLARHLADQAAITSPPGEWAAPHADLVSAWSARADAYQDIEIAIEEGDLERWQDARRQADAAKLSEEEWFRQMNRDRAPFRLTLDQFP